MEEGDKLEFTIEDDGTVRLRTIKGSVRGLFAFLKRPDRRPVTVEAMDESVEELLTEDDEQIRDEP